MMKRIFYTVFFLCFSYSLQSQVLIALLLGDKLNTGNIEFGLDAGINFANIGNMDSNSYLRALNLGFYFDIKMKDQWWLNTGVLVKSTLGLADLTDQDLDFLQAATYDAEGEYSQKLGYFIVPALVKYKFDNHIYAELGPQFGLMHNAYIQFDSDVDGNVARIRENNEDMINRIDMGLSAGVGYRLLKGLGWTLGLKYYYGLTNVYKDRSGTNNSSLFLKMNFPVGLSIEQKDQIKDMKVELKENKAARKKEKKKNKEANNNDEL